MNSSKLMINQCTLSTEYIYYIYYFGNFCITFLVAIESPLSLSVSTSHVSIFSVPVPVQSKIWHVSCFHKAGDPFKMFLKLFNFRKNIWLSCMASCHNQMVLLKLLLYKEKTKCILFLSREVRQGEFICIATFKQKHRPLQVL